MPSAEPWMVSGGAVRKYHVGVAAQVDGGVGRRDLDDLVVGEGVDDVQRDRRRRRTDDDRRLAGHQGLGRGGADGHVGGVTGVLDVVAGRDAVHAARGVDLGDGEADSRDLRGTEEGQVAGQRQDATHPQGVAAVLVALALVVGEGFGRGARLGLRRLCRLRGRVGIRGRRRAAVVGSTGGKGQGQHGGAGHDLGPGHGVGTTHGWDLSFGCTDHRCHDPRVGQRGHRKPAMLRDCTPHPVVSEPLRQSSSRRARSEALSTPLDSVLG